MRSSLACLALIAAALTMGQPARAAQKLKPRDNPKTLYGVDDQGYFEHEAAIQQAQKTMGKKAFAAMVKNKDQLKKAADEGKLPKGPVPDKFSKKQPGKDGQPEQTLDGSDVPPEIQFKSSKKAVKKPSVKPKASLPVSQ